MSQTAGENTFVGPREAARGAYVVCPTLCCRVEWLQLLLQVAMEGPDQTPVVLEGGVGDSDGRGESPVSPSTTPVSEAERRSALQPVLRSSDGIV